MMTWRVCRLLTLVGLSHILLMAISPCHSQSWLRYDAHEYWFATLFKNWDNSQADCQAMGSNLASITSAAEHDYISNIMASSGINDFWIGLQYTSGSECNCDSYRAVNNTFCLQDPSHVCCVCRREWHWIDNAPMEFMQWMPNEPSSAQRCGRIWDHITANHPSSSEATYAWFDIDCINTYRYICKRPLDSSAASDMPGQGSSTTINTNDSQEFDEQEQNKKDSSNDAMVIGISLAVVLIALVVVGIIIFLLLRRRRQRKQTKQKQIAEDHTYYNSKLSPVDDSFDSPSTVYANEIKRDGGYGVNNNNHDADDMGVSYAEIVTPSGPVATKPKPLSPKPVLTKDVQYADLDFSTDDPQQNPSAPAFNAPQDGTEYSSAGSVYKKQISYGDGYADVNGGGGMDTAQKPTPGGESGPAESNKPSPDQLSAMYAQPMKKPKSPMVMHKPAPNNAAVEYAVPMKK